MKKGLFVCLVILSLVGCSRSYHSASTGYRFKDIGPISGSINLDKTQSGIAINPYLNVRPLYRRVK